MITVLRLGHRPGRDNRISTHCGLVARALGADSIIYSGEKDDSVMESVNDVSRRFGGRFSASYDGNFRNVIRSYKKKRYSVVHLTAYGLPVQKQMRKIKLRRNLLVVIGGEKVPGEVYRMSDYNVAVTSQPHSEVAALAIFLREYLGGRSLEKKFPKPNIKIVPQERGKKVVGNGHNT